MRSFPRQSVQTLSYRIVILLVIVLLWPTLSKSSPQSKPGKERVRLVWDYDAEERKNIVSFDVWRVNERGKRLEKLGTWKEPGTPTEANPMTVELPYGTHTIQVLARDKDGVESEAATLKLKVERPKKRPASRPPKNP